MKEIEVNKSISWGRKMDFYHLLIGLWYFGELLLVHCTVSVHSPCLWTNFEGVGFLSKLVDGEAIQMSHGSLMREFYLQFEGPYSIILIYLLIFSVLLLHSRTLSCWWHTCWSDSCAFLRMFDAQDFIYDVWICNIISIFCVSRNIKNTCMKGSPSPCSWITSFHVFGFNIEIDLCHICIGHLY